MNQLISSVDTNGIKQAYTYDKCGNLTEIYKNNQLTHQYHFGALNRLEQVFNHEKNLGATYTYNGLGHRVGKTEGTSLEPVLPTTKIDSLTLSPTKQVDDVLDLTKPYHNLLQRTENENLTSFTWDFGVLSAQSEGKKPRHYFHDDLGTPIRMAGGHEDVMYSQDEFGVLSNRDQRINQPFGFTGYQLDDVSGTLFAQARQYNPAVGRFISQDTHWNTDNMVYGDSQTFSELSISLLDLAPDLLAIGQSSNLYGYTMNNPLRYIDPTGFCSEESEKDDSGMPKWLQKVLEKSGWDLLKAIFNNAENLSLGGGYHLGLMFDPSTDGFFSRLMDNSPTIGRIGKALNKGLPWVGGTIDFFRRRNNGAGDAEAAVMAVGSTVSGFYGGQAGAAIGTVIFPGVGTVIGGIAGALFGSWLFESSVNRDRTPLPSNHGFPQGTQNNSPSPELEQWQQFRNPNLIRGN